MLYSIKIFFYLLLVSFSGFLLAGEKPSPGTNQYIQFKASVVEKSIKPGATGTIQIMLTPKKGIHINTDPAMSIKLDSSPAIAKVDPLHNSKDDSTGYLISSTPITAEFTVAKNAKPGKITVKGMFIYFFCSDAEGWCNRYKQPIELTATISK